MFTRDFTQALKTSRRHLAPSRWVLTLNHGPRVLTQIFASPLSSLRVPCLHTRSPAPSAGPSLEDDLNFARNATTSPSSTPLRSKPPASDVPAQAPVVPATLASGPGAPVDWASLFQSMHSDIKTSLTASMTTELASIRRAMQEAPQIYSCSLNPPPVLAAPSPAAPRVFPPAQPEIPAITAATVTRVARVFASTVSAALQAAPLEFPMPIPCSDDEWIRFIEAAKLYLGVDFCNLASQSANAGQLSPFATAAYTTENGFRKLKDASSKHRALTQSRIDNGEIGASTLGVTPPFPLVAALARVPTLPWKKDELPEFLGAVLRQCLSAILHNNAGFAIPSLLQTIQLLKVVELDSAQGHCSWPFLVPIFEQLAKDSIHRPSIWASPLTTQIQEAKHAFNLSVKHTAAAKERASPPPAVAPRALDRAVTPPQRDRGADQRPRVAFANHHRHNPPPCGNWNHDQPCSSPHCSFSHICSSCKGNHRAISCRSPRVSNPRR